MRKISMVFAVALLLAPSSLAALTITRGLAVGSKGVDVTALQEFLISHNFLKASATGYFGLMTKAAVIEFQKANKLEPVGTVGPRTRALLSTMTAINAEPTPSPAQTPPSTTPNPSPTPVSAPTPPPAESTTLTVTSATPSIFPRGTSAVDMSVTTNRNAKCRYATNPDTVFSSMRDFSTTGEKKHIKTFTSLGDGNLYVYYVKCEDAQTFTITGDTIVSFSISNSASVTGSDSLSAAAASADTLAQLKAMLEKAAVALQTMQ